LKQKIDHFLGQVTYIPRAFRLMWAATGYLSIAWIVLIVFQGILPAVMLTLTKRVVDDFVLLFQSEITREAVQPVLITGITIVGLMVLSDVARSITTWLNAVQSEYAQDYIRALIHTKSAEVDLLFYESPHYYDKMNRARTQASNRPLSMLQNFGVLARDSISVFAVAAILVPYGLWLPLLLFASTLPAFFVVLFFNRRLHHWWEQHTPDIRWTQYYDMLLTQPVSALEIRLFDLSDHFQAAYQGLRRVLRSERLHLIKLQSIVQAVTRLITVAMFGLVMGWMAAQVLMGAATFGDIALFYQAFTLGQGLLRSLLGSIGKIYDDTLFLSNLFEFLELQPQLVSPPAPRPLQTPLTTGIEFKDVTFHYPGTQRAALQNFNLDIPAGKIVAIVGANGAGKSTLVKLACRLYDPQAGKVTIDGVDLRQMSLNSLRKSITVMFQTPVRYQATAGENVALGDLKANATPARIVEAARSAGAHEVIEKLPEQYDTLLGKAYAEGTELSGGEWQRLALARAFLRQAEIILLDEPTSALDSWSEVDWYNRLKKLANGRTTILITHRLTIAKRADIIHVMDHGRLVESGSHGDLLALNGLYAKSWLAQIEDEHALFLDGANTLGVE
jgi:ATP-binding cassette subfamily B protein